MEVVMRKMEMEVGKWKSEMRSSMAPIGHGRKHETCMLKHTRMALDAQLDLCTCSFILRAPRVCTYSYSISREPLIYHVSGSILV